MNPLDSKNVTWEEYKALPPSKATDDIYYNITDWEQSALDTINILAGENVALQARIAELEAANTYNTEEVRIGTWIDGKPLYRKFIDFGTLPSNSTKAVAIGQNDMGFGYVNLSRSLWTGNDYTFTNSLWVYSMVYSSYISLCSIGDKKIQITTNNSTANNYHALVCVEYTKTTD